jgi:hypothetical protein
MTIELKPLDQLIAELLAHNEGEPAVSITNPASSAELTKYLAEDERAERRTTPAPPGYHSELDERCRQ